MGKLIYFMLTSLDGFIAGENEDMDWSAPGEEISAFINERMRPIGTYLIGRKMYDVMKVWQTPEVIPGLSSTEMDFGRIWQAMQKLVYSRTLEVVSTPNTRLLREFDPQMVRDLKDQSDHDISIEGPNLAAQAIRMGLVDVYELLVGPVILGRGIRVLPEGVRERLELMEERRFGNGWVFLRYRTLG